jgi:hypothetical protein
MNNNVNISEIFNISKALIIGFLGFWFFNYLALIVGLTSGVINVIPSTECHIYVPTIHHDYLCNRIFILSKKQKTVKL